jgi:uncharacterized protein YjbJ (UPF0337 family)
MANGRRQTTKAKGKRQKVKGKRQTVKGKRQKVDGNLKTSTHSQRPKTKNRKRPGTPNPKLSLTYVLSIVYYVTMCCTKRPVV